MPLPFPKGLCPVCFRLLPWLTYPFPTGAQLRHRARYSEGQLHGARTAAADGLKPGPSMAQTSDPPEAQASGIFSCLKSMYIRSEWPILAPNGSGLNLSNFNPFSFRTQSFRGLVPPAFPQVPQKTCCNGALFIRRQTAGCSCCEAGQKSGSVSWKEDSFYIYITLPSYRSTHQAMAHIHLRLPELVQLSGCQQNMLGSSQLPNFGGLRIEFPVDH